MPYDLRFFLYAQTRDIRGYQILLSSYTYLKNTPTPSITIYYDYNYGRAIELLVAWYLMVHGMMLHVA